MFLYFFKFLKSIGLLFILTGHTWLPFLTIVTVLYSKLSTGISGFGTFKIIVRQLFVNILTEPAGAYVSFWNSCPFEFPDRNVRVSSLVGAVVFIMII